MLENPIIYFFLLYTNVGMRWHGLEKGEGFECGVDKFLVAMAMLTLTLTITLSLDSNVITNC